MGPEISFEPDDKYHDDNNHDDAYYGDYADAESDAYADDDTNATENSGQNPDEVQPEPDPSIGVCVTTLLLLSSHHFWLEA